MHISTSAAVQSSNFALKTEVVELIAARPRTSVSPSITIGDLEALRVDSALVPASKHGLETICGGSCETGAQ